MTQIGREIPGMLCLDRIVLHNTTEILEEHPLRVRTPTQAWAYAVALEVQRAELDSGDDNEIAVELDMQVDKGEVCVGGLTEDLQAFIGLEAVVTSQRGRSCVLVLIPEPQRFSWLMLRKGASSDHPAILRCSPCAAIRENKAALPTFSRRHGRNSETS